MRPPLPKSLQELPPKQAHLCLGVERFMREELGDEVTKLNGTKVLVACSGGLDSTALLIMLRCLAPRFGYNLVVAHLDHKLRPESVDEMAHVEHLCIELDVPCLSRREDVAKYAQECGMGIEEAAREVRYSFFKKAASMTSASIITTAHQVNDLAEDVLMRLIRGTGWPGLGGMSAWDSRRNLLRPLLVTERNKLQQFLEALQVTWCEDTSNEDRTFFRNRIRHDVMPLFLRENPAFFESIAGIWKLAKLDADYWRTMIAKALPKPPAPSDDPRSILLPKRIELSKFVLENMPVAGRLRLYKAALAKLGPGHPLQDNLMKLDEAWKRGEGGKIVQFPGKKRATILKGDVIFEQ